MEIEEFLQTIKDVKDNVISQLDRATDEGELKKIYKDAVGKKGELSLVRKGIGQLPEAARKTVGEVLNKTIQEIELLYSKKLEIVSDNEKQEIVDLTTYLAAIDKDPLFEVGHGHIITKTIRELEDVFIAMGFSVKQGPEIETDWYNFEALNIPRDHPARGMWDTLYLEVGEVESVLLRTHTSPVQIRVMSEQSPPIYMIAHGKCFRRDTPDASHLSCFHQLEGLVVDKEISFADLKGTIETFTQSYFGKDTNVRLRPSYFPFTEPSAEFEISCRICGGQGCRTCSNTGWLELGGCGVVNENVLNNVKIDPDEYQGFAFGFGIERLIQMRYQIPDLRVLTESDMRFLANF